MNQKSNLAYDYERFEERPKQSKPQIQQIVKPRVSHKRVSLIKALAYLSVAVALISMLIYGRAVQAELEAEYSQTLKEISKVKDENTRLQIQLDSELSLKNIEEIAENELGLKKADEGTVEYFTFEIENKAEVLKKPSLWTSFEIWLKGIFQ